MGSLHHSCSSYRQKLRAVFIMTTTPHPSLQRQQCHIPLCTPNEVFYISDVASKAQQAGSENRKFSAQHGTTVTLFPVRLTFVSKVFFGVESMKSHYSNCQHACQDRKSVVKGQRLSV